ncbi:MAG: hypothetical protein RL538_111 [Candidatus Parcubacteria bacterium]|jgi:hypothetical protein
MDKVDIFASKQSLLNLLGIRDNFLYSDFASKYSERDFPKKNGGVRKIKPPAKRLKTLQREILDKILVHTDQLDCVYGLSKARDLKANALLHIKSSDHFLLNLDIENFFPSLSRKRVLNLFRQIGFSKENATILTKFSTVDNSLPQGAPTSPYLASLACQKMDRKLYNYCRRRNLIYSRYFDDISISGEVVTESNVQDIKNMISDSGLTCNEQKTHLYSSLDKEKIINGVLIKSGALSVPEPYKSEIEACYKKYVSEKTLQLQRIYKGKIGFYIYINRKEALLFEKGLKNKYGV